MYNIDDMYNIYDMTNKRVCIIYYVYYYVFPYVLIPDYTLGYYTYCIHCTYDMLCQYVRVYALHLYHYIQ